MKATIAIIIALVWFLSTEEPALAKRLSREEGDAKYGTLEEAVARQKTKKRDITRPDWEKEVARDWEIAMEKWREKNGLQREQLTPLERATADLKWLLGSNEPRTIIIAVSAITLLGTIVYIRKYMPPSG